MRQLRRISLLLCTVLLSAVLFGCGRAETESEQAARQGCDAFLTAYVAGDSAAVEDTLYLPGLFGGATQGDGILNAIASRMKYQIQSVSESGDGVVEIQAQITTVDLRALLESLPDGISSKEEARTAMIDQAPSAPTARFDATFSMRLQDEQWTVEPSISLVNALTGGLCDILSSAEEVAK